MHPKYIKNKQILHTKHSITKKEKTESLVLSWNDSKYKMQLLDSFNSIMFFYFPSFCQEYSVCFLKDIQKHTYKYIRFLYNKNSEQLGSSLQQAKTYFFFLNLICMRIWPTCMRTTGTCFPLRSQKPEPC